MVSRPSSRAASVRSALRGGGALRHAALLARGGVLVDQALARGAVEQARGAHLLLGGGRRGLGLLERGAERGALRTVAHRRRTGLPHVLLGGRDIRHRRSPDGCGRTDGRRDGARNVVGTVVAASPAS